MLSLRKRGQIYWLEGRVASQRLQTTLGTRNGDAAVLSKNRIERALTEGAASEEWRLLRRTLPETVFSRLAEIVGLTDAPDPITTTWKMLETSFAEEAKRRVLLGKLRSSTWKRYQYSISEFDEYLSLSGIHELASVSRIVVEKFKTWRVSRIAKKKHSRGARSLALDVAILHRVFSFGVELELVDRNPVRMEGRPGDEPECGAQPFKAEELSRLREVVDSDLLIFLVLRWTGMRGSDVVSLKWSEIDFESKEISRVTLKRRKRVVVPMSSELNFALESEFEARSPARDDVVLLNPATGRVLSRPRLYERIRALGRRANVADAHPHRFRDTFCVDMLARGVNPYHVAQLAGITVEMLERHYAPFIPELRERVRSAMANGRGIEDSYSKPRSRMGVQ